jgi:8-oxo-dGTP pyrophosphatase MutT (NUDIX family)
VTRDDLRPLLQDHKARDEKERADRAAMLDFLDRLPQPFSREQHVAHFTASALVVDEARTRTALVHHRKLGIWVQPGGHLDPRDASIGDAALREVREETGIDGTLGRLVHLDIHEIPERPDMPTHLHLDVRFLVVAPNDELQLSDESTDLRWYTLGQAKEVGDASVARLVASL